MASWTALNVEPESDAEEDEYDDTKEIQIEEALKLYNNALRLHAQGPQHFEDAEKAYKTLFASEIFTWAESRSKYQRLTTQIASDDSEVEDDGATQSALLLSRQDSAPNTLPQVLYLSYKNYGQLLLDRLTHDRKRQGAAEMPQDREDVSSKPEEITHKSLALLVEALDKDETDPLLWRKVARVSSHLGSRRVARYALESALAVKAQEDTAILGGMGLEEMSIREELADVLRSIGEDEALIKKTLPKNLLSAELKARLDPFPTLKPAAVIPLSHYMTPPDVVILQPDEGTWESVGSALERALIAEWDGTEDRPGLSYRLDLPNDTRETDQTSNTTKAATSEALNKSRPLQSPMSPIKQSPLEQSVPPTRLSASPKLRRKSLGAAIAGETQQGISKAPNGTGAGDQGSFEQALTVVDSLTSEIRSVTKRDSDSAGLQDPPEGGRSRSKRLRARAETLAEDSADPEVLRRYYEEKQLQYVHADEWIFSIAFEISSKFDVAQPANALAFRSFLSADADTSNLANHPDTMIPALVDFKHCLCTWNLNKSNLLLNGIGTGASATLIDNGTDSGFASFLEHAKVGPKRTASSETVLQGQDLQALADNFDSDWVLIEKAVFRWMECLLRPTRDNKIASDTAIDFGSKYTKYTWSSALKHLLTGLLVTNDEYIYRRVWDEYSPFSEHRTFTNVSHDDLHEDELASIEFAQTVFELHLDTYGKMTGPDSKVDQPTRVTQRWRMARWARVSNIAVSRWDLLDSFKGRATYLALRHLWAYVVYISFIEPASREHILLCYQDLKQNLEEKGSPVYKLNNNAIMPEVSVQALEREMSKEKTMDFFSSIFGTDSDDPVSLIENLEPVLMDALAANERPSNLRIADQGIADSQEEEPATQESHEMTESNEVGPTQSNDQLIEFLRKANAQLRLSLWHQLKTAYERIDYPPMKLICNIRSMEIILKELKNPAYINDNQEDRSANLIVWIRNLADLMNECLEIAKTKSSALDFLAEDNIRIALGSCIEVTKLLHVFAVWEDAVRIEQLKPPQQPPGAVVAWKSAMNFLRDMQPKMWHFLYLVCVDAATQYHELFPTLKEDRLEYLRAIHNAFGMREYCRLGRKSLLKFIKSELIELDASEDDISQVLYDLYNLKFCQNNAAHADHGCTGDQIDRSSALEIVAFVITQTDRMNIKDVLKSDLKVATEKMQAVIGIPRGSSTQQAFNKKIILNYLKAPIVPVNFFKALRGLVELINVPVTSEYATVAKKGWFFLIGHINLAKYRSQKRVTPDNSDDLDDAEKFLRLDLEFNSERWETWYRLAQTYDAKIEESVTWDAEDINNPTSELVSLQKFAIHCYAMAMSMSIRYADGNFETAGRLSDLYTDFATRIYSSSRAPFNMEAFSLNGHERFMNQIGVGTFKKQPFTALQNHDAWTLAMKLSRMALEDKPTYWVNWYMLGKCLWKLFREWQATATSWRRPVDAFVKAIECVPEKRDNRHPERDPILEPHYKLLSVTYKLLRSGHVSPDEAKHILQNSHFARKVNAADVEGWNGYVVEVLKTLRAADKSNWHHRMVARAARFAYDDNGRQLEAAQAAKEKFTQQMFTKSMMMQVWRPEFERPGRHFVYASRYVHFFVQLLEQLGDRMSLEMLGKRIRKKQNDFIGHEKIWRETSHAHLRLLRRHGAIPMNNEDTVFKNTIPFEVFTLNANRLETWAHSQLSLGHATLLLLLEAIELKKLNGTLIDKGPFDDLIGDLYARIYEQVVPDLIAKAGEAEKRERMRIERMLMDSESSAQQQPEGEKSGPTVGRTKTISRTEVRKRAEALVMRPGVTVGGRGRSGAAAAAAIAAADEDSKSPRDVRRKSDAVRPLLSPAAARVQQQEQQQGVQSEADENVGSLHDSADDESELTEIEDEGEEGDGEDEEEEDLEEEEEEEERKLLFPGLAVVQESAEPESRDRTVSAEPVADEEKPDVEQLRREQDSGEKVKHEMEGVTAS